MVLLCQSHQHSATHLHIFLLSAVELVERCVCVGVRMVKLSHKHTTCRVERAVDRAER